jgi:hypothetical protein
MVVVLFKVLSQHLPAGGGGGGKHRGGKESLSHREPHTGPPEYKAQVFTIRPQRWINIAVMTSDMTEAVQIQSVTGKTADMLVVSSYNGSGIGKGKGKVVPVLN